MEDISTTITDKDNFKITFVNETRFSKLSVDEQIIFEMLRNSMLEIMPLTTKIYDDECIRYAENYAFINLNVFSIGVEKIINTKLKELEDKLNIKLNSITASLTTPSTTG